MRRVSRAGYGDSRTGARRVNQRPTSAPEKSSGPDSLEQLAEQWRSLPVSERLDCLKNLHDSYTSRFLSDNDRIWTTAATMIPLSLGSFVILASISKPTLMQILLLAAAAWILMTVWLVIAENHRAFQDNSMTRIAEIEKVWGFERVGSRGTNSFLTRRGRVRQMRFLLWGLVTLGALAVAFFWPGGIVTSL